ncbi:putative acetyltransferase [bacterium BMS3Bbin14]|nr:putative acetyltransferase [bacterium BMS3Bbin14]
MKAMKKTHDAVSGSGSPLKKYLDVIVGRSSPAALFYFEWCVWLAPVPGALGMVLRKVFWPRLFGSCGRGVTFGANIVVRHPSRIHLGDRVVISEQCILDGRSSVKERTIELDDDVILSTNVMLSCKEGTIRIGRRTGVNAQTIIQSTNNCPVVIGDDCVIGQRCFIIGGGSYYTERLDVPIREQGIKPDSGVVLAADVWLGGNVTVLGGVTMGQGSVAAAGAVVTRSVEPSAVCMGVPARVVKKRSDNG